MIERMTTVNILQIKDSLKDFLMEDIGRGDHSAAIFPPTLMDSGTFLLKDDGVVCGLWLAPLVYELLGGDVTFTPLVAEGSYHTTGTKIAHVTGPIATLLTGERLILNLWQRLGGIATATRTAVATLADPQIRICDTRKTVPGLRAFDKYAVTQGGGFNHRLGLDDGIMLKDNHIAYAGGITAAVAALRKKYGHMLKVEVEIESLAAFQEAVAAGVDIIMLDNRRPEEIKSYLAYNQGITTEVSGGITLENLPDYRGCGADYLSLGYLTHSVTALDISFNSQQGGKQ